MNRIVGLRRLWKSLVDAEYGDCRLDLTVCMDKKHGQTDGTLEWLRNSAYWPHGNMRIHLRENTTGLRPSILEAWYPAVPNEVGAFFEDDLEASRWWFLWSCRAIKAYSQMSDRIVGVSLYRPIFDDLFQRLVIDHLTPTRNEPFFWQQPCSWGAIYFPYQWRFFRDWMQANGQSDSRLPYWAYSNRWDHWGSWKKHLIRVMWDYGLYMAYPNLPGNQTLCTNHMMAGTHVQPKNTVLQHLPLLPPSTPLAEVLSTLSVPPGHELVVYDTRMRVFKTVYDLPNADVPLELGSFPESSSHRRE